jgi:hypothetical protein
MNKLSKSDYRAHLIELKDIVFKVLPLYEEENEHLHDYIESLLVELYGLRKPIGDLPHKAWYIRSISTLEQLKIETNSFGNQPLFKKEIFKILNMIDKQIDVLKGE